MSVSEWWTIPLYFIYIFISSMLRDRVGNFYHFTAFFSEFVYSRLYKMPKYESSFQEWATNYHILYTDLCIMQSIKYLPTPCCLPYTCIPVLLRQIFTQGNVEVLILNTVATTKKHIRIVSINGSVDALGFRQIC